MPYRTQAILEEPEEVKQEEWVYKPPPPLPFFVEYPAARPAIVIISVLIMLYLIGVLR
jgi:hypothetical protein